MGATKRRPASVPAHPIAKFLTLDQRRRAALASWERIEGAIRHRAEYGRCLCPLAVALGDLSNRNAWGFKNRIMVENKTSANPLLLMHVVNDFIYRVDAGLVDPQDIRPLLGIGPRGGDVLGRVMPITIRAVV